MQPFNFDDEKQKRNRKKIQRKIKESENFKTVFPKMAIFGDLFFFFFLKIKKKRNIIKSETKQFDKNNNC